MIRVGFALVVFTDDGEIRTVVVRWIAVDVMNFNFAVRNAANAARSVRREHDFGGKCIGNRNSRFCHEITIAIVADSRLGCAFAPAALSGESPVLRFGQGR